jgi:hypothetical protein
VLVNALGPIACTRNAGKKSGSGPIVQETNMANFDLETELALIETRMVDLTAPGQLFRFETFRVIYEHPKIYEEHAIELMGSPDVTDTQKLIIIYAMQRLPAADYVSFAREGMRLCQERRLFWVMPEVLATLTVADVQSMVARANGKRG